MKWSKIRLTVGSTQIHNPVKRWLDGRGAKQEAAERQKELLQAELKRVEGMTPSELTSEQAAGPC